MSDGEGAGSVYDRGDPLAGLFACGGVFLSGTIIVLFALSTPNIRMILKSFAVAVAYLFLHTP